MIRHLYILIIILPFCLHAQNMERGFQMLESGDFKAARFFFEPLIEAHPDNRTAQLCYARAVGLDNNPSKAIEIFSLLNEKYPSDFEIQMNLAEAHLWNSDPRTALGEYLKLAALEPNNFSVNLGLANTYSNLKKYDDALRFVNRSLEISPGNASAAITLKYVQLGRANELFLSGRGFEALDILSVELNKYPSDKDILLSIINIKISENNLKEAESFMERLPKQSRDSLHYYTTVSLIEHLKGADRKSLKLAGIAYDVNKSVQDTNLQRSVIERYIQALIWNRKLKNAKDVLYFEKGKLNQIQFLNLKTLILLANKEWKQAMASADDILNLEPGSINAMIMKASAFKAMGKTEDAISQLDDILADNPGHPEAVKFRGSIQSELVPQVAVSTSTINDNGGNNSYTYSLEGKLPITTKLGVGLTYSFKNTRNNNDEEATFKMIGFSASQKITRNIEGRLLIGLGVSQFDETKTDNFNYEASLSSKMLKNHDFKIGMVRQTETFNSQLIAEGLNINSYFFTHSYNPNQKIGSFAQIRSNDFSDGNQSYSGFASLYTTLVRRLGLKTGVNYQFLSFKTSRPELYFSPEKFSSYELFVGMANNLGSRKTKVFYQDITMAIGSQDDGINESVLSYRIQGRIGFKLNDKLGAEIFGNYTNIASASATGFQINQLGLRLNYNPSRPLFR